MLAGSDCLGSDDGVGVVGGCDHDGVSLVEHLVEHLAIVVVLLCLRIFLEHRVSVLPVDVAESDEVLGLHFPEVSGSTATDTDTEDVQFVDGSDFLLLFVVLRGLTGDDDSWGYRQTGGHCCSLLEERAS